MTVQFNIYSIDLTLTIYPSLADRVKNSSLKHTRITINRKNRVLDHTGPLECIYTHKKLAHGSFAVEHFIPYAFVSHDLIWNLIPADPSFNSRKNNKLPRLEDYFDGYYLLQKTAIEVMTENHPKEPIMEEYMSLFPNADGHLLTETDVRVRFFENIQSLLTIANNNGLSI